MAKPVYTTAQIISQLDSGYHWSGTSLTYGFLGSASWFPFAESSGFSAFSAAQRSAATLAISLWDDLIRPNFTLASNAQTANVKYANTTTNIDYAHAYYPAGWSGAGTVWMNPGYGANSGTNNLVTPSVGQWGFMTYLHETGHALGLDHAGDYNGGSPTYATNAAYMQDSQQYTLMSYFTASNTGADWIASDGRMYFAQTPMLYDIAAIQAIYGADTTTRATNTVYGFNATAGLTWLYNFAQNPHPVLCIYDAGGYDTLDLSGFASNSVIDLTPGSFSSCDMMTSNVSIAFNTWIEAAVGGAGADVITGNSLDNDLKGGAGNDRLSGGGGADVLTGGTGNDTLDGGDGVDIAVFQGLRASYTITYDAAAAIFWVVDLVLGRDGTDSVTRVEQFRFSDGLFDALSLLGTVIAGTANGDNLVGGAGSQALYGYAGDDTLDGGLGADRMDGGAGNDTFLVDDAGDQVIEALNQGIDTVRSTISHTLAANVENLILLGSDAINATGNALANVLTGNAAANILDGGAGIDRLVGGAGDDTYFVDNQDVVVENAGEGYDTVYSSVSYTLASNVEKLVLTGTAALNATGNALDNRLVGNEAANVLNGLGGADRMEGLGGNDTYIVDNAGDVVVENPGGGTDLVQSSISFTLSANVENLTLTGTGAINGTGNELANTITGNAAANRIDGGAGADRMVGGGGNDTYVVDNAGDVVVEAANGGTDTVVASVSYTLSAEVENLTLTGTGAINGQGNVLANRIIGNDAANRIDGDRGNDTLTGGLGSDTFVFGKVCGKDIITDFDTSAAHDMMNVAAWWNNSTTALSAAKQVGADVVITFDASNSVTLKNIALGWLTKDMFQV